MLKLPRICKPSCHRGIHVTIALCNIIGHRTSNHVLIVSENYIFSLNCLIFDVPYPNQSFNRFVFKTYSPRNGNKPQETSFTSCLSRKKFINNEFDSFFSVSCASTRDCRPFHVLDMAPLRQRCSSFPLAPLSHDALYRPLFAGRIKFPSTMSQRFSIVGR